MNFAAFPYTKETYKAVKHWGKIKFQLDILHFVQSTNTSHSTNNLFMFSCYHNYFHQLYISSTFNLIHSRHTIQPSSQRFSSFLPLTLTMMLLTTPLFARGRVTLKMSGCGNLTIINWSLVPNPHHVWVCQWVPRCLLVSAHLPCQSNLQYLPFLNNNYCTTIYWQHQL